VNERDWLTGEDPRPMLGFLRGRAGDRKFRLFQVACCRRVWDLLPDDWCRQAVLLAERFADRKATDWQRRSTRKHVAGCGEGDDLTAINARDAVVRANEKTMGRHLVLLGVAAVVGHAANPGREGGSAAYRAGFRAEHGAEAGVIRCIFGNPFRLVALDPSWRTPPVLTLAEAASDDRILPAGTLEPDRLAVLADALEDAGCTDAEGLGHLREPGPHVRGCFLLDAVLGLQ
jgi:hypothetical protein